MLAKTKDPVLLRWFLTAALVTVFAYFSLSLFYPQSSIIAVLDWYDFGVLFGLLGTRVGLYRLQFKKPFDIKDNLKASGIVLFGAMLVWFFTTTVYEDLFRERLVLEGRTQNPRIQPHFRGWVTM